MLAEALGRIGLKIALIGVVSDESLRPDQRLAGSGRVEITGAGDRLGATGAQSRAEEQCATIGSA